jgi:hypothetical protein
MSDYRDEIIASRLKALLDGRKVSIKAAAEAVGIPYRTLQNQLAGNNRMAASTFVKLIMFLELPAEVIVEGRVRTPLRPLANALKTTLGGMLPEFDEEMRAIPAPEGRTADRLDTNAKTMAFVLREAVERETLAPSDWGALETPPPVSK